MGLALRSITAVILYGALISGGFGILNIDMALVADLRLFLSTDSLKDLIEAQVEQGRITYLIFHGIDYLFILVFYPLLQTIVLRLSKDRWFSRYIGMLCLGAGLCDVIENIILDLSLFSYPMLYRWQSDLLWIVTPLKFLGIAVVVLYLILYAVKLLVKRYKNSDTA